MAFERHKSNRTEYKALLHVLKSFGHKSPLQFYLKYSAARKRIYFHFVTKIASLIMPINKISFYVHNQTRTMKTLFAKMGFIGG